MKLSVFASRNLWLVFLFLGFTFSGYAQPSLFGYEKFINEKGDTLKYRQLLPVSKNDTIRKFPLIIFLHGSGERGNDNEAQLKWGVKNFATDENLKLHPSFLIAPQCPSNLTWANFSENKNSKNIFLQNVPTKPMELLIALINQFVKKFPIDMNRIYITGLSMGGYGTFDAIERYPNLFAAAVPICGGGDTSKAGLIKHIPIWIFHGAEDTAVDPAFSRNMNDALTKVGGHPGYTQYPEVGHFSWIPAYSDPLLMEWLFRQHK